MKALMKVVSPTEHISGNLILEPTTILTSLKKENFPVDVVGVTQQ